MNGDIEEQNLNGNSIKERRVEAPHEKENSQVLDSKFKVFGLNFLSQLERSEGQDGLQTVSLWGF